MPTNIRRVTRGPKQPADADLIASLCGLEVQKLTMSHIRIRHLLTTRHTPAAADDALAAWHRVRRDVLTDWIAKRPGTRPLAWWRYEAPAPMRRIVQGRGHPPAGDPLLFGWPENLTDRSEHVAIESEAAYLERHELLMPEERASLSADAFKPITWTDPVTLSLRRV
jgi:hypothetical protein